MRRIVVLGALVAVALVGLWRFTAEPRTSEDAEQATRTAESEDPTNDLVAAEDEVSERAPVEAEPSEVAHRWTQRESEKEEFLAALTLSFYTPDGKSLDLERVTAELVERDGEVISATGEQCHSLRVEVPLRTYRLRVEAPGVRHLEETIDASLERGFAESHPVHGLNHRVVLWPDGWIPIRVRTPDGRAFESITAALGWQPKRLFVDAFRIATRSMPIEERHPPSAQDERLATFHPPDGWQNVRISDDVIGSLDVVGVPPFHVGLWVHGEFAAARVLEASDDELTFELSADDFFDRLGRVELTLVDRDTHLPVTRDATVTLKAETSAHRRHDLSEQEPDEAGRIVLERVIPGLHELTIERGGSFLQRELQIAPGEELDLGEIPLGDDAPIEVSVVDATGAPVQAWIEIAPYVKGAATEDLYHPNLHRTTDHEGRYDLPVPQTVSILRARPYGTTNFQQMRQDPVGTRNVLVDPESPPAQLTLTVDAPQEVRVEVTGPWSDGHFVEIVEPELELVVERFAGSRAKVELVPGRYRLLHEGPAGETLGVRDVVVAAGEALVRVP
ncbi:MAG: hypothetical protein AAGA20_12770 [Planctomycetota bacterium]